MVGLYRYTGVYYSGGEDDMRELSPGVLAETELQDEFGYVKGTARLPYSYVELIDVFAKAKAGEPLRTEEEGPAKRLKKLGLIKQIYKKKRPHPTKPRYIVTSTFAELTEEGEILETSNLPRYLDQ